MDLLKFALKGIAGNFAVFENGAFDSKLGGGLAAQNIPFFSHQTCRRIYPRIGAKGNIGIILKQIFMVNGVSFNPILNIAILFPAWFLEVFC